MSNIKAYTKDGETLYHVKGYLGIDPLTGKQKNFDRRGFKTKREADLAYSKAKIAFEEGDYKKRTNEYTFEEVYKHWLKVYEYEVRESTFVKTTQIFENHVLPEIGNYIITKIQPFHLQELVNEWHKKFKSHKTFYNYMKRVFKYAYVQEYIKKNPTDKVIVPKKKIDYGIEKKTKDFYSKPELELLLNTLKEHEPHKWYTVFRLFAYTGIRRGELLALKWKDIDFKEATLNIDETLTTGMDNRQIIQPPKTDDVRKIGLDQGTIQALKQWKAEQAEFLLGLGFNALSSDQIVFSNERDNGYLNLSAPANALVRICKRHDIEPINLHGFRHTHASLLLEAGLEIEEVMDRLGHSDIQTTMNIYTHITPERKDKSGEKFARFMNI